MAASVTVVLDVTPPQITLGPPLRVGSDRLVAVPYTLDEPELLEAQIGAEPATVTEIRIVGASPLDQGGTVHVTALVRDDVWNEALVAAELELAPWFAPNRARVSLAAAAAPTVTLAEGAPVRPDVTAERAPRPPLAALTAAGAVLEALPAPRPTLTEEEE